METKADGLLLLERKNDENLPGGSYPTLLSSDRLSMATRSVGVLLKELGQPISIFRQPLLKG